MNDTLQTRREFLRQSLFFLAASYSAPFFLTRTALALDGSGTPDDHILVVIQMGGGNDGLNTVVPYAGGEYYRAGAGIRLAKEKKIKVNDAIGLHPNLAKLKALYDNGRMAIIQGVGYPNPDRSHFRSMEIWHTADPKNPPKDGWLGRYFAAQSKGTDPKSMPDPKAAINIGTTAPLSLHGEKFTAISF